MNKIISCLILISSLTVYSLADSTNEKQNTKESIQVRNANTLQTPSSSIKECMPMSVFNGNVNAISGDYIENSIDLTISGMAPMSIPRSYTQFTKQKYKEIPGIFDHLIAHGWEDGFLQLLSYSTFEEYFPRRKHGSSDREYYAYSRYYQSATVRDISGSRVGYYQEKTENKHKPPSKLILNGGAYRSGLTNTSYGVISGRTNLKNNSIPTTINKPYQRSLKTGSGLEQNFHENPCKIISKRREKHRDQDRKYSFKRINYDHYWLVNEKLPNGNKVFYERNNEKQVTKIKATDSSEKNVFGEFLIKHSANQRTVETMDGRKVCYEKNGNLLSKVTFPDGSINSYEYNIYNVVKPGNREQQHLLTKSNKPNGRYTNIEYSPYFTGNLVSRIKEPVGINNEPITTSRFKYELHSKGGGLERGVTSAYDAYDNLTKYHYGNRLNTIEEYAKPKDSSGQALYRIKNFHWGPGGSQDQGQLVATSLKNNNNDLTWNRQFIYDERGNVLEERLYGNITGTETIQFKPDGNGYPQSEPETRIFPSCIGKISITLPPKMIPFQINKNERPDKGIDCQMTSFTYSDDGLNLPLSKTDANGTITKYQYKKESDLITAEFVGTAEQPIQKRTFCSYDENCCMTKKIVDDGSSENINDIYGITQRMISIIKPYQGTPGFGLPEVIEEYYYDVKTGANVLLSKVVNSYDKYGNVCNSDVYDSNGQFAYQLSTENDINGRPVKEFDSLGRTKVTSYDLNGNITNIDGFQPNNSSEITYDFVNRPVQCKYNSLEMPSRYTLARYDYKGNVVANIDKYGNETAYEYDGFSRVTKITSPPVINENGEIIQPHQEKEYDISDNVTVATDERGYKTIATYNVLGKPVHIEHPDKTTEDFFYNIDGTLRQKTETDGRTITYTYDFLGRVTDKTQTNSDGIEITTSQTYSTFNLISSIDGENVTTNYHYDGAGRIASVTKDSSKKEYSYDNLGRLETTKEWFDNEYIATVEIKDLVGRTIEKRLEDQFGNILEKHCFTYDNNDNCISEVATDNKDIIKKTDYFYNGYNELIKTIDALGNSTENHSNHKNIDNLGQYTLEETAIDTMGIQTISTYDSLGRIVTEEKKNPFITIAQSTFYYDAAGNKTRRIDNVYTEGNISRQYTVAWEYGPLNRLENIHEEFNTPQCRTTQYIYNQEGQLEKIIKPNGIILSHTYDGIGRLKTFESSDRSFHYSYHYDNNSRILNVIDNISDTTSSRRYNSLEKVTEENLANNLSISRTYDEMGRPTAISLPYENYNVSYTYEANHLAEVTYNNNTQTLSHRYEEWGLFGPKQSGIVEYTYDGLGRKLSIASEAFEEDVFYDTVGNVIAKNTSTPIENKAEVYQYNDLYQLISENNHKYAYDSLDNRLQKDDEEYTIVTHNELEKHGNTNYEYDLNGNVIKKVTDDKETIYAYDGLGRLTSVTEDNLQITFSYDAFNRRLDKTVYTRNNDLWKISSHLRFLYVGDNEIGSMDDDDHIVEFRVLGIGRGAEIGAAVFIELNNTTYIPLHNCSGDVVALADPNTGEALESYQYTAYGEETIFDSDGENIYESAVNNPWRLCSKRTDDELGFVFFGKRYYNPATGRWTTPDPRGFDDGPNLYAYVHNNPLTLFDLYGEWSMRSAFRNGRDRARSAFSSMKSSFSSIKSSFNSNRKNYTNQNKTNINMGIGAPLGAVMIVAMPFEAPVAVTVGAIITVTYVGAKIITHIANNPSNTNPTSFSGFSSIKQQSQRAYKSLSKGNTGVAEKPGSSVSSKGSSASPDPDDDDDDDDKQDKSKKEPRINQMNRSIQKGHGPKGITRIDAEKLPNQKTHAHFDGRKALNIDGSWRHGSGHLNKEQTKWLSKNGWKIPN